MTLPLGRVAPYVGLGGGLAIDRADRGDEATTELSASGGLRLALADRLGGLAEVRLRGIGSDFDNRAAEFTVACRGR